VPLWERSPIRTLCGCADRMTSHRDNFASNCSILKLALDSDFARSLRASTGADFADLRRQRYEQLLAFMRLRGAVPNALESGCTKRGPEDLRKGRDAVWNVAYFLTRDLSG
jgi:hypothetical protein